MYVSEAPEPGGLHVRRWIPQRITSGLFYRTYHAFSGQVIRPFARGVENVVSGMKERVFFVDAKGTTRPPCVRSHEETRAYVERVSKCIGACTRVAGAEFIATRSGSKRKMYERARLNLSERPRTLREMAELSYFVKYESTVHSKVQVPRIISPRSFEFNYLLGRYMRPIEHQVFDALSHLFCGVPVVAKGLTQQQKGQLIHEKMQGRVGVGLDASRFDQTISAQLLKMEHSLYEALFPGDRLLASLLKCQLNNSGRAICHDGIVKARMGDMRCSGDQNTSLGNCIISCFLARKYFDEHGIDGDVINDGDDLVMFVKPEDLHKLDNVADWYLSWGLRMKVEEPAYVTEQVEFCQSKPVWTLDGYVLVRNPRKCLNTDYCGSHKVETHEKFLVHLRSVGLCGLSMAAGIPILQTWYEMGVKNGKTGKLIETELGGKFYQMKLQVRAGHLPRSKPVDPRTRESFWLAFGVEPSTQLAIEGALSQHELSRQVVNEQQEIIINNNHFEF